MALGGIHRAKGQDGLGLCLEILALQVVGRRRINFGVLEVCVLGSRKPGLPWEGTRHDQRENFLLILILNSPVATSILL